jgi:hypothetical protein
MLTDTSSIGRNVIVTLKPPNLIELRLKGMRQRLYVTVESVYWAAMKREVENKAKKKARKKRKKR